MSRSGSYQLGKLLGIPIKMHWTFGLLMIGVLGVFLIQGIELLQIFLFFVPVIGLFASVILHELGHALAARYYGINTRDIIISPIGGLARLDNLPEEPKKEMLIALAGPAVNLILAFILLILAYFSGSIDALGPIESISLEQPSLFLGLLLVLNLALFGFNLIPAFPMDGGRVLRAALAMRLDYYRATLIAARIGQVLSVLCIILSFFIGNFILLFAAMFIFFMAREELKKVRLERHLYSHDATAIMRRQFTGIHIDDVMSRPIELMNTTSESSFLVINNDGQIAGVLHELFIKDAEKDAAHQYPVIGYLSPNFKDYPATALLSTIRQEMNAYGMSIVTISDDHKVIAVIDRGDFMKLLQKEG